MENMDGKSTSPFLPQKHPLLIDAVLQQLFPMIDYESLKNCRSVCTMWNSLSKTPFYRRTKLYIGDADIDKYGKSIFSKLRETFGCEDPDAEYPVSAFMFESSLQVLDLKLFLNQRRHQITELSLSSPQLFKNEEMLADYNISPLLKGIHSINSVSIETWSIPSEEEDYDVWKRSSLTVPLELLANVEYIHLTDCDVVLNGKIAPKELELENNRYFRNGTLVPDTIVINDFLSLNRLNKLTVTIRNSPQYMALDVSGDLTLKKLDVKRVELTCKENRCNWIVNKVSLNDVLSCPQLKDLKADKMVVCSVPPYFDHLPMHVKILTLYEVPFQNVPRQQMNFSLLTTLSLHDETVPLLKHFQNCNNLVNLELSILFKNTEIQASDIPPSVKVLKLRKVEISGRQRLQKLNRLIITPYWDLDYALKVVSQIHTRELAVEFLDRFLTDANNLNLVSKWILKLMKRIDRIYVGDFGRIESTAFEKCPLYRLVDELSDYYFFTNNTATTINEYKFKKLTQLTKDSFK